MREDTDPTLWHVPPGTFARLRPVDFVIARNPDRQSSLPFLVRLPLGRDGVALKARDVWPRTSKLYCHRADEWPDDSHLEVVERVTVRSCVRRGAAIDLVLDRSRENRSQFVFTKARGREVIFWQSARTAKQARPNVTVPTALASGHSLEIIIDTHERYPWSFSRQQATTVRRSLRAGDYAVELDGTIVAAVERKSLTDLVATLTTGRLRYVLAELANVPRSAVVVEDRYSAVFKLDRIRPLVVVEALAETQVRYPNVPIVFCETRLLAQEWAYRYLGAAAAHVRAEAAGDRLAELLPSPGPISVPGPTVAEVRKWALAAGMEVSAKGRLRPEVWAAFRNSR